MKLFLGLTSILVICVMFMSLENPKENTVQKPADVERNTVLDRLVELGSKCLYLESKWEDLEEEEKFARLQESNTLFGEFEYLQIYLKTKVKHKIKVNSMQNYVLAALQNEKQYEHVKAMRLELDHVYRALINLHFDDQQLFEALNLITYQLDTWCTYRKGAVLNGMAKAIAPFKKTVKEKKGTQLFEQLEKLCSTVELVKSKDAEGLYILSLKSALSEIEYFVKNREIDETNYKV